MEKWIKQLTKMPWHDRARVDAVIKLLIARDFILLDRQQLKGHEDTFRIRVGNYRIIYHDDGKIVTIIEIPRRNEGTYNF